MIRTINIVIVNNGKVERCSFDTNNVSMDDIRNPEKNLVIDYEYKNDDDHKINIWTTLSHSPGDRDLPGYDAFFTGRGGK
jgi:hypothetical protein